MKKLLFFASDYKIGISQVLTDQVIAINVLGVNVVAVGGEMEQQPELVKKIQNAGVELERIHGLDQHKDFFRLVRNLKNIIVKNDINIVHVQNNWQLALVNTIRLFLIFRKKINIIYTIHGFRNNKPLKSKIAQVVIGSALLFGADRIICMTKYLKKKFQALSYKIDLLPLGIDNEYFLKEFIEPRTDALHLIFPAQFREGKNHDMIINAFGEYVRKTNDKKSTLTLPGQGDLMEQMKSLVKELGLSEQVIFPGFLTKGELLQYYLESNIAVVGSNSETFGQSIVEPYVLGRCVLSTPVGIATEIIEDDANGFIFRNSSELTKRLIELNNNHKKLITIGKNNFSNRDIFRWSNVITKYNQIFDLK